MEIPICRFCLDETNVRGNELISPCACIGSIAFVHEKCLIRWRSMAPSALADVCQMCRTHYNVYHIRIEVLPNEHGFTYQLLICPYIFTFGFKYVCFMFSGLLGPNYMHALHVIHYHQIFFHIFYIISFLRKARINNLPQYVIQFRKGYRSFMIVAHILFWYFAYQQENIIFLYLVDIFLPFYWHTHLHCLREINERNP